jgi:hypothetical protein
VAGKVACPMCGNVFDGERRECRTGCPLGKGCNLLCCPRCHYGFPVPESRVVNFLKSLMPKGVRP